MIKDQDTFSRNAAMFGTKRFGHVAGMTKRLSFVSIGVQESRVYIKD
jgi:hypothetical protein